MRQVGTLPSEREARRFAAWLVAQRIEAHAEQEQSGWVVWVRDEDQLPAAREALTHFREHPSDPKYQDAQRSAGAVQREEESRRKQAQSNVVEMRGRWGTAVGMPGAKRKAPLVMALIAVSAVVALLTYSDTIDDTRRQQTFGTAYRKLVFVDPHLARDAEGHLDMWASIRRGEIWRLVTPIFIHYGLMHIVLNMFWLYSFGGAVEDRRGSRFMLLLVTALAISSNVGQAIEVSYRGHGALFGGMSGVGYGLLGYIITKNRFDSRERYSLSPGTTFIAMLWFTLCILRDIPPFSGLLADVILPIANAAHAVGLLTGAAIAYLQLMVRKPA
jgi:GlpG protein